MQAQEVPTDEKLQSSPAASPESASGASREAIALASTPESLTFRERLKLYELSFYGSSLKTAVGWGAGLLSNDRYEWGRGAPGEARRLGFAFADAAVGKTIQFGVAAATGEDTRYRPSRVQGFLPRFRYAVRSTFVSPKVRGGESFAFSRFADAYGSAFISNLWYPDRLSGAKQGISRGSKTIGMGVGLSVLREFAPDIKKKIFHRTVRMTR